MNKPTRNSDWKRIRHGDGTHTYRAGAYEICQMADNGWHIFKMGNGGHYRDTGYAECTLKMAKDTVMNNAEL